MPPRLDTCVRTSTLYCAACFALLLALGLLAAVIMALYDEQRRELGPASPRVQAAAALAATLKAYGNHSVRPCDDFYEHVCGAWLARQDPAHSESAFGDMQLRVEAELARIAQEGWPLLQTWYDSCRDTETRRARGLQALEQGPWAAIDAPGANDTLVLLGRLHRAGVQAVFWAAPAPDPHNSTLRRLTLYWPDMLVPYDIAAAPNTTQRQAYFAAARAFAVAVLGSDAAADAALALEARLAGLMSQTEIEAEASAEPAPVALWPEYAAALLGAEGAALPRPALDAAAGYPAAALALVAAAPREQLRQYLRLRAAAAVRDTLQLPPANETDAACVASLERWLAPVLGHYYAREYADPAARTAAERMLGAVLAAFGERLGATSWMDEPTRAAALRKLAAIRPLVGWPEHWALAVPPSAVAAGDLVGSALRVLAAGRARELGALAADAPVERYAWEMAPYDVNAYYSPEANDIVFPRAILGGPFFNASAPLAANFGGLGSVMGHEVGHAFDDSGRRYDWDGNERDWWSAASAAAFDERAQCVVGLYDGLPVDGTGDAAVDGGLTLGENWADLTGLDAAFRAFRLARASLSTQERALEALLVRRATGASEEQLFFRAWALHWCGHRTPAAAYELALSDPHAPSRWRVNVPAAQSAAFRKAFGCRAPARTCELA